MIRASRSLRTGIPALLAACVAVPVAAQTGAPRAARWEIEGVGGFVRAATTGDGSVRLPQPGPPLPTTSPIFPTRETPSWFFGDGASLLNGAVEQFGLAERMQPLDAAFASLGVGSRSAGALGVRLRRDLTARYGLEIGVDLMPGSGALADEFVAVVDASRESFETTFRALFATGPFVSPVVSASAGAVDGSTREIAVTGALNRRFAARGALVPYVTVGGGLIAGAGNGPGAALEGRYRFAILAQDDVPIEETDAVTLRLERRLTVVGLVGAGLRKDVTDRWGFRVDGRVMLGPSGARLRLGARPSSTPGTPAGFIESGTNPGIQFSNSESTGRRSTLGGPGLDGFSVWRGSGLETRVVITVGVFRRF